MHTFSRHIAGDRGIVRLPADLVDFVDIDNAALRPFNIIVRRLQKLENDVLNILTHIASFGQRRGISHRKWYIENARQCLGQQGLAGARWSHQHDVGLCQFYIGTLAAMVQALVVIVYSNRQHALRMVLANDIVIQHLADFMRRRHTILRLHQRGFVLLADDVHAELHAFIANEYSGSGNQLAHLMLAFAAERTIEGVLAFAGG